MPASKKKPEPARFVQIAATSDPEGCELIYALDATGDVWSYYYDPHDRNESHWVPLSSIRRD
jgi:hypothetical protein